MPTRALQEFQQEVTVRNIVARYKEAIEFPSQEALDAYMKKHPNADPKNHSVRKQRGEGKKHTFNSLGLGKDVAKVRTYVDNAHKVYKALDSKMFGYRNKGKWTPEEVDKSLTRLNKYMGDAIKSLEKSTKSLTAFNNEYDITKHPKGPNLYKLFDEARTLLKEYGGSASQKTTKDLKDKFEIKRYAESITKGLGRISEVMLQIDHAPIGYGT